MARLSSKNIIHSADSLMIVIKGDKRNPEPSTIVIKFPGGHVEVSRCSDDSYYAHITADKSENIIDSRIEYNYEGYLEHGVPDIPDHNKIKKLAVKIKGEDLSYE